MDQYREGGKFPRQFDWSVRVSFTNRKLKVPVGDLLTNMHVFRQGLFQVTESPVFLLELLEVYFCRLNPVMYELVLSYTPAYSLPAEEKKKTICLHV